MQVMRILTLRPCLSLTVARTLTLKFCCHSSPMIREALPAILLDSMLPLHYCKDGLINFVENQSSINLWHDDNTCLWHPKRSYMSAVRLVYSGR